MAVFAQPRTAAEWDQVFRSAWRKERLYRKILWPDARGDTPRCRGDADAARWFWFANVVSALVWAPMLLFAGDTIGELGDRLIGLANTLILVFGGLTLFGIAGVVWAAVRASRLKRQCGLPAQNRKT